MLVRNFAATISAPDQRHELFCGALAHEVTSQDHLCFVMREKAWCNSCKPHIFIDQLLDAMWFMREKTCCNSCKQQVFVCWLKTQCGLWGRRRVVTVANRRYLSAGLRRNVVYEGEDVLYNSCKPQIFAGLMRNVCEIHARAFFISAFSLYMLV